MTTKKFKKCEELIVSMTVIIITAMVITSAYLVSDTRKVMNGYTACMVSLPSYKDYKKKVFKEIWAKDCSKVKTK